jgi:hypothetical protein
LILYSANPGPSLPFSFCEIIVLNCKVTLTASTSEGFPTPIVEEVTTKAFPEYDVVSLNPKELALGYPVFCVVPRAHPDTE